MKFIMLRFEYVCCAHKSKVAECFHIEEDYGEEYIVLQECLRKDRENCVILFCQWHPKLFSFHSSLAVLNHCHIPCRFHSSFCLHMCSYPKYCCRTLWPVDVGNLDGVLMYLRYIQLRGLRWKPACRDNTEKKALF